MVITLREVAPAIEYLDAGYNLRRNILLETAEEYGFANEEWETLARETASLRRALRAVERVDEMETGVACLERRQQMARECLETLLKNVEMNPLGRENATHQHNYNRPLNPHQDTVIAAENCSGEGGDGPVPDTPARVPPKRPDKGMVHGIRPDELVRLTPRLKLFCGTPPRLGRRLSTPPIGCGTTSGSRSRSGAPPV